MLPKSIKASVYWISHIVFRISEFELAAFGIAVFRIEIFGLGDGHHGWLQYRKYSLNVNKIKKQNSRVYCYYWKEEAWTQRQLLALRTRVVGWFSRQTWSHHGKPEDGRSDSERERSCMDSGRDRIHCTTETGTVVFVCCVFCCVINYLILVQSRPRLPIKCVCVGLVWIPQISVQHHTLHPASL